MRTQILEAFRQRPCVGQRAEQKQKKRGEHGPAPRLETGWLV